MSIYDPVQAEMVTDELHEAARNLASLINEARKEGYRVDASMVNATTAVFGAPDEIITSIFVDVLIPVPRARK